MKNSPARFRAISDFQFVQSCACNSKFDERRGDGSKNIYLAVLSADQRLSVRSMDVCYSSDADTTTTTDSFIMDVALMDGTDQGLVCFGSYLTDEGILWMCIFNHNKVIGVDLITRQLKHQLNNILYPNAIIRSTKNSNLLYVGGGSNHRSPFIKDDASDNAAASSNTAAASSSPDASSLGRIYELNMVANTCTSIECGQLTTVTGLATIGADDMLLVSQSQNIVVVSSNSSSCMIDTAGSKEEPAKVWNGCSVDDSSACYIIDKFSKWDDFKVVAAIYRKIPTGRRLFTAGSMHDHDDDDNASTVPAGLTSWLMACMMNCFSNSCTDEVKESSICSADLLKPLSEDDRLDDVHFLIFDSSDCRPYHFKLDHRLFNAPEGVDFDGRVTHVQRHGGRIAFINFRRNHVMIIDDAEVAGIINQFANSIDDVVRENIDYLTSAFGVLEAKLDWKLQQKDEVIESLTASLEVAQKNCSYLQRQLRNGKIVYSNNDDGGNDVQQIGGDVSDVMLEYNDLRKKYLESYQSSNNADSCSDNSPPRTRTAEQERLAKAKNDLLNTLEFLCVEENTVELNCIEQLRIQEEKIEEARKEKLRITKEKEVIFARLEQLRIEEEADEIARLELEKIEEERAELAKLQQMRIEEQKAESTRLELLRIQEQKAELERIINARRVSDEPMTVEDLDVDFVDSKAMMTMLSTEAEKEELARLEQLLSLVEKAELVRLDHLRIEEEKEELARLDHIRLEEEKEELARLQQRRIDEEQAHNDRMQQLKLKEEKAEKARQDQLRLLEQKAEQARLVQLQIVEEKAELARLEQRQIEEEKIYLATMEKIKNEEKNADTIRLKEKKRQSEEEVVDDIPQSIQQQVRSVDNEKNQESVEDEQQAELARQAQRIEMDELKRPSLKEQNTKLESSEQCSRVEKEEAQRKEDKKEGVSIEDKKEVQLAFLSKESVIDEQIEIIKSAQNKSDREKSSDQKKRSSRREVSDDNQAKVEDEAVEEGELEQRRMLVEQAERIILEQIEKEKIESESSQKKEIPAAGSVTEFAELDDIVLLEDTPVPEQLMDQRTEADDCK